MRTRFRIIRGLLSTTCGIGVLAFLSGFVSAFFGKDHPDFAQDVCFPMSDPQDVVADRQGRIHVALAFYSRIQVYDSNGRFLHGYFVASGGGRIRLDIDRGVNVIVIPARSDRMFVYDKDAKLISSPRKPQRAIPKVQQPGGDFLDSGGNRYTVANRLLNPVIQRADPKGRNDLVIQTPLMLRPVIGPLPCWLTIIFSGLLYSAVGRWASGRRLPGEGIRRTEGALADDSEWDAIMEEIHQDRRQERRPQTEERQ